MGTTERAETEAEKTVDVDLLLNDGIRRIIFDGNRWFITGEKGHVLFEVLRSYALEILATNGLKNKISEKALQDVRKPDQLLSGSFQ